MSNIDDHLNETLGNDFAREYVRLQAERIRELERELSEIKEACAYNVRRLDEEIIENDGWEQFVSDLAAKAGCIEEWSSVHDHRVCLFEHMD